VAKKPRIANAPPRSPSIKSGAPPELQLWAFSFRFFQQMRYFGVGGKDASWFASVLDKLGELSRKTVASTRSNRSEKLAWRLHEIDWSAKSIPIQRKDLSWIDAAYLNNEAEYPILQFQITKALGRVIGFFDERGIFNIVLLDPMHNAQPSAFAGYKVRATLVSETEVAALFQFVEQRIAVCKEPNCVCRTEYAEFHQAATKTIDGQALLVHVSDALFLRVTKCVSGGTADSLSSIIEIAMDALEK
jgi:hypothetical protein